MRLPPAVREQIPRAARMAADWWSKRMLGADQVNFHAKLLDLVERRLRCKATVLLEVDDRPKGLLLEALRAAGIPGEPWNFLPLKHSLLVRRDRLEPKEGYANWTAEIPVPAGETEGAHPMKIEIDDDKLFEQIDHAIKVNNEHHDHWAMEAGKYRRIVTALSEAKRLLKKGQLLTDKQVLELGAAIGPYASLIQAIHKPQTDALYNAFRDPSAGQAATALDAGAGHAGASD